VGAWDDEDDWVGEPPEGHHTRDRANPAFWRNAKPVAIGGAGLLIALVVLLVVALK
jgi:hypothetical protein